MSHVTPVLQSVAYPPLPNLVAIASILHQGNEDQSSSALLTPSHYVRIRANTDAPQPRTVRGTGQGVGVTDTADTSTPARWRQPVGGFLFSV